MDLQHFAMDMQRFIVLPALPVDEPQCPECLRLTPFIAYELFEAQRPFDARQGVLRRPNDAQELPLPDVSVGEEIWIIQSHSRVDQTLQDASLVVSPGELVIGDLKVKEDL